METSRRSNEGWKSEEQVLGIPQEAPASVRPVSAYLGGSDETGAITRYGPIIVEVSNSLRPESWVMLGDLVDTPTLGGGQVLAPVPLSNPSIDAASYRWNMVDVATMADACGPHRYAEVLIFGVLTPDDVTSITYPDDTEPAAEVVAFSEKAPWKLLGGKQPKSDREPL